MNNRFSMTFFKGSTTSDQRLIMTECRAEVIKIEHPTRGDDTRAWGPPYAKQIRGDMTESLRESAYYLSVSKKLCPYSDS